MTPELQLSPSTPPAADPVSGPRFRPVAEAIAERLAARALRTAKAAAWEAPAVRGRRRVLPPHLYDGSTGISLFLAACRHAGLETVPRDLVLGSLFAVRGKLSSLAGEGATRSDLPLGGAFLGLASLLYATTHLAVLVDEEELVQEAVAAATRLAAPDRIAAQRETDLVGGVAGLLLVLLRVRSAAEARGFDTAGTVPALRACGRFLRSALDAETGASAVPGFAHGLSGVAYALARLDSALPREGWGEAAALAFARERDLFRPEAGTWWNPARERLVEQAAWCQGAPGMLLARTDLLARGSAVVAGAGGELEELADLTLAVAERRRDHLCCGSLGQAWILDRAARTLARPDLADRATEIAEAVAARMPDDARLPEPEEAEISDEEKAAWIDPGLMTGLAGIGYGFLALEDTGLPNLLVVD